MIWEGRGNEVDGFMCEVLILKKGQFRRGYCWLLLVQAIDIRILEEKGIVLSEGRLDYHCCDRVPFRGHLHREL